MGITIKDVAKAANVSVATVSRVLNKKSNVSESAIAAVNAAINELGYNPGFFGRDLRWSETRRLLAVIPALNRSFYSDAVAGMDSVAAAEGYDTIIATNNDDPSKETRLLEMLFSRTVDGAVLFSPKLDARTISGLSENHNVAVCLERLEGCKALTVATDNVRAGNDAVSYLIGKGHKKVGMITTEARHRTSVDREKGYRQALKEHNIGFDEQYIYYGDYSNDSGMQGCAQLLGLKAPPTAIFCVADTIAIGAMNAASIMKKRVGKDIMFFGFDNISFSRIFQPHLSTVEQPCVIQGRLVAEKLIRNIKTEKDGVRDNGLYMIPHSLVLRESTGD